MTFLLKLIVTSILLALIVWHLGGLEEVGELMVRIPPSYVLLVFIVNTLDRLLMTFKWGWLLRGRGVYLPLWRGMRIYCASMVWGMVLPATIGADVIRVYSTSRMGYDVNEIVASIIIERVIGFLSALLLGILSLALLSLLSSLDTQLSSLDTQFYPVRWIGGAMAIGTLVVFVASFNHHVFSLIHDRLLLRFRDTRIMRRLRRFHTIYLTYQHDKRNLTAFFALTFSEQLIPILHLWLIARGLGIEINLLYIAGAVSLTMLVSRIPVSVNSLGVFDGVFMLLMSLVGYRLPKQLLLFSLAASWRQCHGFHGGELMSSVRQPSSRRVNLRERSCNQSLTVEQS